jgi:hypothetical protein
MPLRSRSRTSSSSRTTATARTAVRRQARHSCPGADRAREAEGDQGRGLVGIDWRSARPPREALRGVFLDAVLDWLRRQDPCAVWVTDRRASAQADGAHVRRLERLRGTRSSITCLSTTSTLGLDRLIRVSGHHSGSFRNAGAVSVHHAVRVSGMTVEEPFGGAE